MATQSFLKSVTLRGRKEAQAFVRAVERSENFGRQNKSGYEPVKAQELDAEAIKKMFCGGEKEKK